MAGRIRLTEEAIDKLKPEAKPYTVGDVTRGLRVHVAVSGKRTFQLSRNGTTLTLGECGHLKLAAGTSWSVMSRAGDRAGDDG